MKIKSVAAIEGYTQLVAKDPYLTSFVKVDEVHGRIRVNIWTNEKNETLTVGTCLTHPKQGKTQLFRKHCSIAEALELLRHPRKHTGKGYR